MSIFIKLDPALGAALHLLSQINARGPSVVIAEMDTIAQRLSSLQNGKIVFD
jgi:hypothetical protein